MGQIKIQIISLILLGLIALFFFFLSISRKYKESKPSTIQVIIVFLVVYALAWLVCSFLFVLLLDLTSSFFSEPIQIIILLLGKILPLIIAFVLARRYYIGPSTPHKNS